MNNEKEDFEKLLNRKGYRVFSGTITDRKGQYEFGVIQNSVQNPKVKFSLDNRGLNGDWMNYIENLLRLRNILDEEDIQSENFPHAGLENFFSFHKEKLTNLEQKFYR